jgi:hypothetical protein
MKYLNLLILVLPFQLLFAQPDKGVYWGFDLGAKMMFENNNGGNHSEILPPPNLYLHLGNVFNDILSIDAFAGYVSFSDNWDGIDLGVAVKSQVINKLYLTAGYNYNSLSGDASSGNGNHVPYYSGRDFNFASLGAGYYLTKLAYVELNYEIPLNSNKVYGNTYYSQTLGLLKLNSRLKFDFGWNFSL